MKRRILVTSALPYANGPLHIGHLAGAYLPADVYVRFQKMRGSDVIYICGTDEHGVPITITAEKEKKTPLEIVNYYHKNIKDSFDQMFIYFDNFSQTSREIHHKTTKEFFLKLNEKGFIEPRAVEQMFCPKCNRFLPDRYIEGICPHCNYKEARGDQCSNCGKWLEPTHLIEPYCKVCGTKPFMKSTVHWFFKLSTLQGQLESWISTKKDWKDNVLNFCKSWFQTGLEDRPITRDIEWGVSVPLDEANGKVFYVWFDAPIGYISSTKEWALNKGEPDLWKDYWFNENTELVHFIGKDNIVFHAIMFPAMLMAHGNYILPSQIPANEFLTIEGRPLSTSRNWAIWIPEYLKNFKPDSLRYAIASNPPETKDCDFSWKEFQMRNNNELASILGNFANRVITFVLRWFDGAITDVGELTEFENKLKVKTFEISERLTNNYENFSLRQATKEAIDLAREGNKFFDSSQVWKLKESKPDSAKKVLYACLSLIRSLSIAFAPIIPESADKLWKMLGLSNSVHNTNWSELVNWDSVKSYKLSQPQILFPQIQDFEIQRELDKLKSMAEKFEEKPKIISSIPEIKFQEQKDLINYETFSKLDLRVAEILEAKKVPGADKLLHLTIDIGFEKREIVAGIAQFYSTEELIGKKIAVLINLEPRKMRNITSNGMLLAASTHNKDNVVLLIVDKDIPNGSIIS